jgi:aerobic C4-dicarboxylate transport protein
MRPQRLIDSLYLQVLTGITLGVLFGLVAPEYAVTMKPLGDGFIKIVRMLIAPVVFTTVVVGIAQMGAMKEVGRIGFRALLYFEVVSTVALVIGLVVVNLLKPGEGIKFDPSTADVQSVSAYATASKQLTPVDFILHIIPDTMVSAFSQGEVIQVLLVSILVGMALLRLGKPVRPLVDTLALISKVLFDIVNLIMRLAPLGAFGSMAFTVGRYGIGTLVSLGQLMAGVYITCALFVFVVLGFIAKMVGFSLWKFLKYIGEEILIVLGTSSSETVLPRLMSKLERLGCSKTVVGLVVPTGYSFNLDGTSIYMTMAAVFLAQACGVQMTLSQQLGLLAMLMLTSKGAAAVTGGGFITLAASLAVFPSIPIASLTLLLGVDRFMSEARSITNLIGNGVATLAIARWDGALDVARVRRMLDQDSSGTETADVAEDRGAATRLAAGPSLATTAGEDYVPAKFPTWAPKVK